MKRKLRVAIVKAIGLYLWRLTWAQEHELTITVNVYRLNGRLIDNRTFNCYSTHVKDTSQCK